jgi:hypothetical protein
MDWKGLLRYRSWYVTRYFTDDGKKELWKTKNILRMLGCSDRGLQWAPSECKSDVSPFEPTCSVAFTWLRSVYGAFFVFVFYLLI